MPWAADPRIAGAMTRPMIAAGSIARLKRQRIMRISPGLGAPI
jgi:hypothetical protein